jgi:hypothetical protein
MNSVSSASHASFHGIGNVGGSEATVGSLKSAQDMVKHGGNDFGDSKSSGSSGSGSNPLKMLMDILQQILGMIMGPLKQLMGMIPGMGG